MNNIKHYQVKDVLGYICELSGERELDDWKTATDLSFMQGSDSIVDCFGRTLVSILQARGYQIVDSYTYEDENRNYRISLEYRTGLYVNYRVFFNNSNYTIELKPMWYDKKNFWGKTERIKL